jgi:hypothetical protein
MKCPKCDITLPENTEVCPLCHTPVKPGLEKGARQGANQGGGNQETRRFAAIDPSKETYDFDLQYTLTFKDAGEIRQAIDDMELGIGKDRSEELLHPERAKKTEERRIEHRQRSQAEMEEAAMRAALRRERRNQGKRTESSRRSHVEKMSRTEREKAAALRSARPKRNRDKRKNRRLIAGVGVLAVVVALIIGAINMFAGMMEGDMHYPTIYTKGNQLYMVYDKKPILLSENLIAAQADLSATAATNNTASKKFVDPKMYKATLPTEKQLLYVSADGLYTFFFENMNMNTGKGDLVYIQNDSAKSRTLVASNVYYQIQVSADGKSVLYLRDADDTGYHGELCYWLAGQKESLPIQWDVCANNFVFSQDGLSAIYIKNFNPIVNTGDLCVRALGKDAEKESVTADEKVAFVFGTTPKGILLYAKDYDTKTGTYNLYAKAGNGEGVMYAQKAFLPPRILKKTEAVYAYSDYHDNFQSVNYVDFASGQINPMVKDITRIERIRMDEAAVIYTKEYENGKSDYYVIGATENASQKIANGVVAVSDAKRVQFDVSDDFSRVAYIGGYDEENGKGALFTLTIINGYVGIEKRISDEAYSCDVSSDGAVVRFASNYDKDAGTVSLAAYENSNTVTLTEHVSAGAFTYDKAGAVMVYATNVKTQPQVSGDVECVNNKGKVRQIEKGISSYGMKQDGMILLLKRDMGAQAGALYYSNQKGKKIKLMDEGVTKALIY